MSDLVVFSPTALEEKARIVNSALTQARARFTSITSHDDAAAAAEWLSALQTEERAIDEMKQGPLSNLRATEKQIRDWFRPTESALTEAIKLIKDALGAFTLANKQLQREAFREAADLHVAGDGIAARDVMAKANDHASKTKVKGVSSREVWEAQVVDASAVPREWCVPDEKRIAASARSTHPDADPVPIPGVRYVRKVVTVGRPRTK